MGQEEIQSVNGLFILVEEDLNELKKFALAALNSSASKEALEEARLEFTQYRKQLEQRLMQIESTIAEPWDV